MAKINTKNQTVPATPTAGYTTLYVDSADKHLKQKDDAGVVTDLTNAGADEKSKVSANDTTEGYLNGKLVAGTGITLTENNDGGNETLTIATTVTDTDVKTKVSSDDTTAGFLNGKLVAGTNITFVENSPGGNETLTISATSGSVPDDASSIIAGQVFC